MSGEKKPWHHLKWWIAKIPTILKGLGEDLEDFIETYTNPKRRLWITVLVAWNIFAAIAYLSGWLTSPLMGTLVVAQIIIQFAFMIGMAIIQFVAIFWFMAKTKTDIILPGDGGGGLTFADYKGQPNLVKMMKHWLLLMQSQEERLKFQKMGGRFPTGILLYGAPGTGKTLLAKCMAGEGTIAFMSIEGSGFRAMFMGVDVLKMMAFCNKAKQLARQHGACIAYIDEIDAVGASRGGVAGGQQQVGMMGGMMGGGMGSGALTRLLYEMDGIDMSETTWEKFLNKWRKRLGIPRPPRKWHVLYMGGTNRLEVLDAALRRPGRFDREIEVPLPDAASRRELIKYYLSGIVHDDSVDVETLVKDTPWASPAKIMAAITKDAVRIALAAKRNAVSHLDIAQSLQEQAMGLETPIEEMSEPQKRILAYHEAGHAAVLHYLVPEQRLVHGSLAKRGSALAHIMRADNEETYVEPLDVAIREIMVSMAGQCGVMVLTGKRYTGTGGDYPAANRIINGLLLAGVFGPPIGDLGMIHTAYAKEVRGFWVDAENKTVALLQAHWPAVVAVAEALLEKTTVQGDELVRIMDEAVAAANGGVS
jgi:cell division protease FtsH